MSRTARRQHIFRGGPVTQGIALQLLFDEGSGDPQDSSGNGNHTVPIISGDYTLWKPWGIRMDGDGIPGIQVDTPSANLLSTNYTAIVVFRSLGLTSGILKSPNPTGTIFRRGSSEQQFVYNSLIFNGFAAHSYTFDFSFEGFPAGLQQGWGKPPVLSADWHMVTIATEGVTASELLANSLLREDGVELPREDTTTGSDPRPIDVFELPNNATAGFDADFDYAYIAVWDRKLSIAEIERQEAWVRNYVRSRGVEIPPNVQPPSGGLVGVWTMEAQAADGQSVLDSSGEANSLRRGTTTGVDGNDPTKVPAGFQFADGLLFQHASTPTELLADAFTCCVAIRWDSGQNAPVITWDGANTPVLYAGAPGNGGRPLMWIGASIFAYFELNDPVDITDDGWHFLVFSAPGKGTADVANFKLRIDGQDQVVESSSATGGETAKASFNVGDFVLAAVGANYEIAFLSMHDREITDAEKDAMRTYAKSVIAASGRADVVTLP